MCVCVCVCKVTLNKIHRKTHISYSQQMNLNYHRVR